MRHFTSARRRQRLFPERDFGRPRSSGRVAENFPANSHPSNAELTSFAVGKLAARQAINVEQHLAQCDRCAEVVARAPHDAFVDCLQAAGQLRHAPTIRRSIPTDPVNVTGGPDDEATLAQLSVELRHHPRYRFIRLLAEGGMGAVYLAEHRIIRNLVAIKTIKPDRSDDRDLIERFLQEARTAGQLSHSNIARILDAERVGETIFLAIEYVPGETLAELVIRKGPLSIQQACHYVRQIAVGLEYASWRGVVHRDIKPQNIMVVSQRGGIKILDFGLGRFTNKKCSRTGLTSDDDLLGTPHYMAPEQAKSAKSADVLSDIYSLGCTFYFLLTGEPPFFGRNALELLAKHENDHPESLLTLRHDMPHDIADLVQRMLAKDPRDRPQSAKDIAVALAGIGVPQSGSDSQAKIAPAQSAIGKSPAYLRTVVVRLMTSPIVLLPLATILISLIVLLTM